MKHGSVLLGLLLFAVSASTLTLDPSSVPRGWSIHDLSRDVHAKTLKPGVKFSLTYPGKRRGPELASVFGFRSKALDARWPDDVAAWTARLVGPGTITYLKDASLTKRRGQRVYRVEYGSDSTTGTQILTALLVIEVVRENETRLVIFRYEEGVEAFYPGLPVVRDLYDVVSPLDF